MVLFTHADCGSDCDEEGTLMAEITERDRELAHEVMEDICAWPLEDHSERCASVAIALANHAAEARREENRECELIANGSKCTDEECWDLGHAESRRIADAIAARRGGHG
jgi:hypothetical protein